MKEKTFGDQNQSRWSHLLYSRGMSTFEVLIAFAIFILILTAIILVSFGSQKVILEGENSFSLLYKAKSMIDEIPFSDFDALTSKKEDDGLYTKEIIIEPVTNYAKKGIGSASLAGNSVKTVLSEIVIDPDENEPVDTCNLYLNSDWKGPRQTHSLVFSAFDTLTKIDILNKKI
jgi:hypothetical protein